jgi:hypothetical protein
MFFKVLTSTRNRSGLSTIRSGGFTAGQGTRCPLHSILGELQGRSGCVRRRENSLSSQGFKPRTIRPVANQYTNLRYSSYTVSVDLIFCYSTKIYFSCC